MKNRENLRDASSTSCWAWFPHRRHVRPGVASTRKASWTPKISSTSVQCPPAHPGKPEAHEECTPSERRVAAVRDEDRTGHEAGGVAGQEQHGGRELLHRPV